MALNVLGISGSPVKNGNTETFLQRLLKKATAEGNHTEAIYLSCLDITDCMHCNFCLKKQQPGKYCSIADDAQKVFEKVEACDILVIASPVYLMRTSSRMAAFLDRLRLFVYGNLVGGTMKNKIGVSAAVSWMRQGGLETTHLTHILAFMVLGMIPVSADRGISPLGASAVASKHGSGIFDKNVRLGVQLDEIGLKSGDAIMERAMELAGLIKRNPS